MRIFHSISTGGTGDLSGDLGGNFAARDLTGRDLGAARFDRARDLGMAAAEKELADGLQVRKWEVYRKREEERGACGCNKNNSIICL